MGVLIACHNPEKHKGGLQMSTREGFLKGSDSGPVFQEDKPAESLLLKVLLADADPHMPPKKQLTWAEVDAVYGRLAASGVRLLGAEGFVTKSSLGTDLIPILKRLVQAEY